MPEKKASPKDYKKWHEENVEMLLKKNKKLYYSRPNSAHEMQDLALIDLYREWEGFTRAPFPTAASGQEVNGVDLFLIHSEVAGYIQTYVDRGSLDRARFDALEDCAQELKKIVPMLAGDTAAYFERLLDFAWTVIGTDLI